ncbi:MAG: hypothetical protein GTO60_01845, partial [Gammaproteobacteria bacterium]|nr:hypothetical protein [Gammaproteobacteria bacterium]
MLRITTGVLLFGISFSALTGEIEHARARHASGEYEVEISATLIGSWEDIYSVATDFEQLSRLSDVIVDSGVVENRSNEVQDIIRRWLITRICFPFYC